MGSELAKALAAFQADIPTVAKTAQGDTGVYKFDYAPLEDVTEKALPLLGKHGLSWTCLPGADDQGRLVLDYALLHESGEEKTGSFPLWMTLPEKFKAQTVGGVITYFRRYCLCAVTGVAPGGDDHDADDAPEVHMDRQSPPARQPDTRLGRLPARGDDMWDEVRGEERPGSADPADLSAIKAAYVKLGFDPRTDALRMAHTTEQLTGRAMSGPNKGKTHKNLTWHEAKAVRGELEGFGGDRGALLARLSGVTQAAEATAAQDAAEDSQEVPS